MKITDHHPEKHFTTPRVIRDTVFGIADGLTVPFALAAGLSGALDSNTIVIVASLAEIAAGTISMGLGGYLAAKSDLEHYRKEEAREQYEVKEMPEIEVNEVKSIFRSYGLKDEEAQTMADALRERPQNWVDFMMRFELGLERPRARDARQSALTIGISYAIGGIIPLTPYFFISHTRSALLISAVLTLSALFTFGYVKGLYISERPLKSALQMAIVGGLAAAVAFTVATLVAQFL